MRGIVVCGLLCAAALAAAAPSVGCTPQPTPSPSSDRLAVEALATQAHLGDGYAGVTAGETYAYTDAPPGAVRAYGFIDQPAPQPDPVGDYAFLIAVYTSPEPASDGYACRAR